MHFHQQDITYRYIKQKVGIYFSRSSIFCVYFTIGVVQPMLELECTVYKTRNLPFAYKIKKEIPHASKKIMYDKTDLFEHAQAFAFAKRVRDASYFHRRSTEGSLKTLRSALSGQKFQPRARNNGKTSSSRKRLWKHRVNSNDSSHCCSAAHTFELVHPCPRVKVCDC